MTGNIVHSEEYAILRCMDAAFVGEMTQEIKAERERQAATAGNNG